MATDITKKFTAAVATMSPGEVIKDECFQLYDSVSAIEIGDKKMDSGIPDEGESLEEEYDVTGPSAAEEILGIIDELLCLEMAWHLGYPLSQTVLTSVHVDALMNPEPKRIDDVDFTSEPPGSSEKSPFLYVLRAYCAGLVKSCFTVNELVKETLYYEEEDFVTNNYGRSLLGDIPIPTIRQLLRDALTKLAATRDPPRTSPIIVALISRLELRLLFLDAIDLATSKEGTSGVLKFPWTQMRSLIDEIAGQHSLARPVARAFSTKLQRRLTSTMPPRPMVSLSFDECVTHFRRLFEDGSEAIDILQYKDPQCLLHFILFFQERKPQSLVFVRAMIQYFLFQDMTVLGRLSIRQLLDDDLSINGLPCGPHFDRSFDEIEVQSDPRLRIAVSMEEFRQRVADAYLSLFNILCQNRCRVRRMLGHHIHIWHDIEGDVERIESRIKTFLPALTEMGLYPSEEESHWPLRDWVHFFKMRQLDWIVKLGFELRIYQADEFAGMYRYLAKLAEERHIESKRAEEYTMRRERRARSFLKLDPDEDLPESAMDEYTRSKQYHQYMLLDISHTLALAEGLSLFYAVLMRLGFVKQPPQPYGTNQLRHELRMRPFDGIIEGPSYADFVRETEVREMSTDDLLLNARGAVAKARQRYSSYQWYLMQQSFTINDTSHGRWKDSAYHNMMGAVTASVALKQLHEAHRKLEARIGAGDLPEGLELDHESKLEECEYAKWMDVTVTIPEPDDRQKERNAGLEVVMGL
ncbi:hypothetical protein NPX13_g10334 [Xylaria arbuscula]|uniref:Amino-acid N-acetyltransferase subunit Mak10 n=1 Tax=Xylaria arbuscula TaxID=114810 RepID=A0A9W8N4W8_9PEZI|nr:hypothetical protein NPX13_g10334 [Xylaria arbuscula]